MLKWILILLTAVVVCAAVLYLYREKLSLKQSAIIGFVIGACLVGFAWIIYYCLVPPAMEVYRGNTSLMKKYEYIEGVCYECVDSVVLWKENVL